MTTATDSKVWTWQEALKLPDGDRYEVINGELRERCTRTKSSAVAMRLARFLWRWIDSGHAGQLTGEAGGYTIFPWTGGDVRMPDIAFLPQDVASGLPDTGWYDVPPAFVAEVVSPNDRITDAEDKARDYIRAGVGLVWVIVPSTQAVHVWHADGSREVLKSGELLSGGDVLPDFQLPVADLFANSAV